MSVGDNAGLCSGHERHKPLFLAGARVGETVNAALRALARAAPVRRALVLVTGLSLLGVGGTVLAFVTLAHLLAGLALGPEGLMPGHLSPGPTLPWTSALPLLALGLALRAIGAAGREWVGGRLAAGQVRALRAQLAGQALALGPVLLSRPWARDLGLLSAELGPRLTPFYARFLPGAAHAGVSAAVILAVTAWLDPATALLLALTGPLTLVFLALVGLATQSATEAQWQAHTRLGERVLTLVRHLPTLHAFGQVEPYRDVLARSAAAHRETTVRVLRLAFLSGFVMEFAATLATALIAVWIGVRLFGGEASLAPTLAALLLVAEFFGPLRQLGADRHAAMDAEPLAARLAEVFALPRPASGERELGDPAQGGLDLTLRGLRPEYPGGPAFAPVSLHLPAGSHLALRGPSGSGKSSLLHVLGGHLDYAGSLLVGGIERRDLSAASLARRVASLPQHPRLLAASVRDNLRLGDPDADDARLIWAAQAVGLWGVLGALPGGLDAPLGEGGTELSGGETARLALARALLSGAELILLDELTAHLDPASEAEVLAVLERAFAGKTVILATHRGVPAGFSEWRLDAPLRRAG